MKILLEFLKVGSPRAVLVMAIIYVLVRWKVEGPQAVDEALPDLVELIGMLAIVAGWWKAEDGSNRGNPKGSG